MYQPRSMNYGMMYSDMASLKKSLDLIKEAVAGEREDELFYDYLISVAPTEEEQEIIASIRDDEKKHNKMFRSIYRDITGMDIIVTEGEEFEKPASYIDGIATALFGELKAVEKYRVIRQGLPNRYYRDMLFEIITDELKHSSKYNYIYTLNKGARMTRSCDDDDSNSLISCCIVPAVTRILDEIDGADLERAAKDFRISNILEKLKDVLSDIVNRVEDWEKSEDLKIFKKPKDR
ncbi:ferritin-like domain-containing protein [Clostridium ganghwense]|uniref:Ferritin-like domain-containing protein n=1 Tax=Clostridium ganghwense TaxID=312089 RepID=A0ABT4CMD0_9CLOT|nr:ferritin-like domain-containing protein [Clostridium ganghwense]MCY6370204.1 ferritin-like domain-containing protein [Clostridium ganghwense]